MTMLIKIHDRNTKKVLHQLDRKNNTILITLKDGIDKNVNLRYSNLNGSDLRNSDLRDTDLRGSDLRCSDLSGTDLRGTDLHYSNLPKTDVIINDRYHIHIRPDIVRIGCEKHKIEWWEKLTYEQAETLDSGAGEWWTHWKPIVFAIYGVLKKTN